MTLLAIDPGNTCGFVEWNATTSTVERYSKPDEPYSPEDMYWFIKHRITPPTRIVIEGITPRGQRFGRDVRDVCYLVSGLCQWALALGFDAHIMPRLDVQRYLCGRVNDAGTAACWSNLIDKFGGRDLAVGGVKCRKCKGKGWFGAKHTTCPKCGGVKWLHRPGPFYGIKGDHTKDALCLAVTWSETNG